jgi:hypothetical protein
MCNFYSSLLLSLYDTGSSFCYIMHSVGGRAVYVLLVYSYVTLRIFFGYGWKICIRVQSALLYTSIHTHTHTHTLTYPSQVFSFQGFSFLEFPQQSYCTDIFIPFMNATFSTHPILLYVVTSKNYESHCHTVCLPSCHFLSYLNVLYYTTHFTSPISLSHNVSALLSFPVMSKCSALHNTLHLTNLTVTKCVCPPVISKCSALHHTLHPTNLTVTKCVCPPVTSCHV